MNNHYMSKTKAENNKENPPCQYTALEMKERIEQGLREANKGLGASVEEMRKLHPRA
jgi:hypothetical protein